MPKKKQGRATSPKPKNKKMTKATKIKVPDNSQLAKLPNALSLTGSSGLIIWRNKKPLSLIILVYGVAYLVLVLGLSSPANVVSLKKDLSGVSSGHFSSLFSGVSVFTYLIGSTAGGNSSAGGSAYQLFITIVASLSIIWALRQFYKGEKIRARDSYYHGLYPLAQFILVLLFIAVELIPMVIGLSLYALLINGGIAVSAIEKILSLIVIIGLIGWSLYLLTSSIISLYIVTLPDMTPIKALRSAKGLVKGRRWSVFRKILFLPVILIIFFAVVIIPFILLAPALAAWIFIILTLVALVYIHSYLYNLYRGLINEQSPS